MKQLLNQYDVDSKQKGEENKVLTDKLNRLIKINTDLLENKPTEPVEKIVVEVNTVLYQNFEPKLWYDFF